MTSTAAPPTFERIQVGDVSLHTALAGPEDGPLVVMLHGFPERWFAFRHQVPALAAAGFRVAAPDQRGYGDSDRPSSVRAYRRSELVEDVRGLVRALGRERCALVGHDWGGVVAWYFAQEHAALVDQLCVLNCPHPSVVGDALRKDNKQRKRMGYMLFFQAPWLPERYLKKDGWRKALGMLRSTSRPGTFSDDDLAAYRESWSRGDTMTTMLNWYRAAARYDSWRPDRRRITPPVRLIWGLGDRFLTRELAERTLAMCDDSEVRWLDDATHWLAHEEPDEVSRLLLEALTARA